MQFCAEFLTIVVSWSKPYKTTYTSTFFEIYNKAWHAVLWALYDPLHTNAQNRSAWLRWVTLREKTRDKGEHSSTSKPNPFKYWRDCVPLCIVLRRFPIQEETKSRDTQCSTQKSTFHKHVWTDVIYVYALFSFQFFTNSHKIHGLLVKEHLWYRFVCCCMKKMTTIFHSKQNPLVTLHGSEKKREEHC